MDLGSVGWTQFQMSKEITSYIAEHIELIDCDLALVHSHHKLGAFFSGQDIHTLQSEGDDTNCFVSLIVDTPGNYKAAITRKVTQKKRISTLISSSSYEFFGEGTVFTGSPSESSQETEETVIEYFMLNVEREETTNPFDYLDARFDEIQSKKSCNTIEVPKPSINWGNDYDFDTWRKNREVSTVKEQTLFDDKVMQEMVDVSKWQPDPTITHFLACQLITCSLIINKDIDIYQWVTRHMVNKYNEIFSSTKNPSFEMWVETYVDFIIEQYSKNDIPEEIIMDEDLYKSRIAASILDSMEKLPSNEYMDEYKTMLKDYIYE